MNPSGSNVAVVFRFRVNINEPLIEIFLKRETGDKK